jgi:hypothetical protein
MTKITPKKNQNMILEQLEKHISTEPSGTFEGSLLTPLFCSWGSVPCTRSKDHCCFRKISN